MMLSRERAAGGVSRYAFAGGASDSITPDSEQLPAMRPDSVLFPGLFPDSLAGTTILSPDSLSVDTLSTEIHPRKPFLEDVISGKNKDSLIYSVHNKKVYIYEEGDITYQNMNMKGDFMQVDMASREIFAHGRWDTVKEKNTRPEFTDGKSTFTMDTITYNIDTKKARIKGVSTQEGEGFLTGVKVKKMSNDIINIAGGYYTTCDLDHPHFYLAMTKAKAIPGKKVIVGPSYLVMEDVPLYFLGLPFGFFPSLSGRQSGFIMPQWGEEAIKGFFLRNGGYYFALNDYVDLAATGGIYTLGSWEASLSSRYLKRYSYSGGLNFHYTKNIIGEPGDDIYNNSSSYNVTWSHTQDPKFRPGSSFSASVNFSTSGYQRYGTQTIQDYLNTQTNSSIAYTKSWLGTPFTLSTNMAVSQNQQDSSIMLSFPNVVFNVARINPFQRKNLVGKQRWYEKITFNYTGTVQNSVTTKMKTFFSEGTLKQMRNGVNHQPVVNTSFMIFRYININPAVNYHEVWYFQKINRKWDPERKQVVVADTVNGFYRLFDYNFSLSATTKVYGTYQYMKNGKPVVQARHVLTPSISFSYIPDFSAPRYGYYQQVQSDTLGNVTLYSPFQNGIFGVPSAARSQILSFRLQQNLEIKVPNRNDSIGDGYRKIRIIDDLSFGSSYNFLLDSFNLANFPISFRTTLYKNINLNINATLDPYQIDANGRRINKFMLRKGKLGRITQASTFFGYSFNSPKRNANTSTPAANDFARTTPPPGDNFFNTPGNEELDAQARRAQMTSAYYDFDIPWNFSFDYSVSYSNSGRNRTLSQTMNFRGSLNLTPKWSINLFAGYDITNNKFTPGQVTMTRDLHCWQMHFTWVPVGFRQSWSFTIGVKAGTLSDLKYDRNSNAFDSLFD